MIGLTRALALSSATACFALAEPRLQWVSAGERGERIAVEVSGLDETTLAKVSTWPPEKLRPLLAARVQQPGGSPAMLGTWKVDVQILRFTPQFPLTPGVAYRAEFDPAVLPGPGAADHITADFTIPAPPRGPATVLTQVHPSAEEVPENLLKFYLHFSAPMSRGRIYDHIHLRDEAGREVDLPFLELDEELWDPAMQRLTLFIDPGRIKREVRPLEEIGPALQAGRRFTLVIDATWLDAAGHPLAQKFERTFRVGLPDRTPIKPSNWKTISPAAGSTAPLCIDFLESMDHALALRLLRVVRPNGETVLGTPALTDSERKWSFTPSKPWLPGIYHLVVPTILEDLAGNNVGKAFEVEISESRERVAPTGEERVRFEVK